MEKQTRKCFSNICSENKRNEILPGKINVKKAYYEKFCKLHFSTDIAFNILSGVRRSGKYIDLSNQKAKLISQRAKKQDLDRQ